jgi:glycosyltransferase involved in cell wall biosynthesis
MPELLVRWGVPREQILVLPSLYVDLEVFRPPAGGAGSYDQDVLYVGRMVNNKGLDHIVDALARCTARGKRVTALFVGKGPLAKATRERARARGLGDAVRFLDWVDTPADLARCYQHSRLVVCASTCEGGPRFTVEAMACGTPVVSTPVGVMPELLRDGDAGLLCGFGADDLAAAFEELLGDDARRAALGARAHEIAQRFEYSRTIRTYAEGLIALAGGAEPPAESARTEHAGAGRERG